MKWDKENTTTEKNIGKLSRINENTREGIQQEERQENEIEEHAGREKTPEYQ